MEPNTQIYRRYPDLLGERGDPAMTYVIGELDAAYNTAEPPATLRTDLARAVRERAEARQPDTRQAGGGWSRLRLPRRASVIVAAVLAAVLALGAGAYALEPLISQVFRMEPGTQQILEMKLAQSVHVTRSLGGFTMTVEKVYADSNRVVVGYTVQAPPDHAYSGVSLVNAILTTDQGGVLPGSTAFGSGETNHQEAEVAFFDASSITGNPSALQLHLTGDGLGGNVDAGSPSVHPFQVLGALAFDFSVAFHPGRIAEPHQSVTVHGVTMRLERVIVTRTETRIYLSGATSDGLYGTLSVDGWTSDPDQNHALDTTGSGPIGTEAGPNGETIIHFDDALYDKHGEWTLVAAYAGSAGAWSFHFDVP